MLDIEEPPSELPEKLQAYLRRMFISIDKELNRHVVIKSCDKLPLKPQQYTMVHFKQPIPNTAVTSSGVYLYVGNDWQKII